MNITCHGKQHLHGVALRLTIQYRLLKAVSKEYVTQTSIPNQGLTSEETHY